jgi:hypothetical protein
MLDRDGLNVFICSPTIPLTLLFPRFTALSCALRAAFTCVTRPGSPTSHPRCARADCFIVDVLLHDAAHLAHDAHEVAAADVAANAFDGLDDLGNAGGLQASV